MAIYDNIINNIRSAATHTMEQRTNKEEALRQIKILVAQFAKIEADCSKPASHYNETQTRADFISPFFKALGWDVDNSKGLPQDLREVIHEDSVDVGEEKLSKKPDYAFRLARQRKFYVEAKKPSVKIETDKAPSFQTRRYGFSAGLPISVLTNFQHLAIYDCVPAASSTDDPRIARLKLYTYKDYVAKFDEIYSALSFESVLSGEYDKRFKVDTEKEGTAQFDEYFLSQVISWRERLAQDLHDNDKSLSPEELTIFVQRILNRLIFLRICEDRELEKYETLLKLGETAVYDQLKALLELADKKYNSGLFDLLSDPTVRLKISDKVLRGIIEELYYPKSPYTFAVVEASVLGDIYELFLGSKIDLDPQKGLFIADKPEVVASGGIVPTPKYIVDSIIDRVVSPKLKARKDKAFPTVLDMCCGSGVFLLAAYKRLISHFIDVYKADPATHSGKEIYQIGQSEWRLSLHEKQRILLSCIYGVDIDDQAVEVARFSLLLCLIEDETNDSIAALQSTHGQRALPKLDANIKCGNSLIDSAHFHKFLPSPTQQQLIQVNPFDWDKEFPIIPERKGFDFIIGNPPYIRIQNMVEYSPDEVDFYHSDESPYHCGKADSFDKYTLFVERALQLSSPIGLIGLILPHKFFTIKSGEALRELISKSNHLAGVTHFGVNQVFGRDVLTYTCILTLTACPTDSFSVEHVADLSTWRYGVPGKTRAYSASHITSEPWSFISPEADALFARIKAKGTKPLKSLAEIFVGVQTSADKIYIIKPTATSRDTVSFPDINKTVWEIEKSILRPCMIDVQLESFEKPKPNAQIIFPYKIENGVAKLFSTREMRANFPKTYAYLEAHKEKLSRRNMPNTPAANWHQYGRSQSLTKFCGEKLIFPILSKGPKYAFDSENITVTGGGNGPYYLIRMREGETLSLKFIQAVLFHPAHEAMIRSVASAFQGGYYSHGKQFIENLPIPDLDLTKAPAKKFHDSVLELVTDIEQMGIAIEKAKTPKEEQALERKREHLKKELVKTVSSFWGITDDEIGIAQNTQIYLT